MTEKINNDDLKQISFCVLTAKRSFLLLHLFNDVENITFNVQVDGVADTIPLSVVSSARVDSCIGSGDFLQDQALIGDDDFFLHVMTQFASVMPPRNLIGRRASAHRTFKVDVIALFYVGSVEAASEVERSTWHICKTKIWIE